MENKRPANAAVVARRPVIVPRMNLNPKPTPTTQAGNGVIKPGNQTKFTIRRASSINKGPEELKHPPQRNASVNVQQPTSQELDEVRKIVAELEVENQSKKTHLDSLLEKGRNMAITKKSYEGEQENLLKEFKKIEETAKDLSKRSEASISTINSLLAKEKELDKKWKELRTHWITRKEQGRVRSLERKSPKD
jgi:chromosome segregation ATPase